MANTSSMRETKTRILTTTIAGFGFSALTACIFRKRVLVLKHEQDAHPQEDRSRCFR
jgi:hypothetical protein